MVDGLQCRREGGGVRIGRWFVCAGEGQRRSRKMKKAREQLEISPNPSAGKRGEIRERANTRPYDVDNDICDPKSYAAIVLF
jgi:hypothetical protein